MSDLVFGVLFEGTTFPAFGLSEAALRLLEKLLELNNRIAENYAQCTAHSCPTCKAAIGVKCTTRPDWGHVLLTMRDTGCDKAEAKRLVIMHSQPHKARWVRHRAATRKAFVRLWIEDLTMHGADPAKILAKARKSKAWRLFRMDEWPTEADM